MFPKRLSRMLILLVSVGAAGWRVGGMPLESGSERRLFAAFETGSLDYVNAFLKEGVDPFTKEWPCEPEDQRVWRGIQRRLCAPT
jgi:hypothetical protein